LPFELFGSCDRGDALSPHLPPGVVTGHHASRLETQEMIKTVASFACICGLVGLIAAPTLAQDKMGKMAGHDKMGKMAGHDKMGKMAGHDKMGKMTGHKMPMKHKMKHKMTHKMVSHKMGKMGGKMDGKMGGKMDAKKHDKM